MIDSDTPMTPTAAVIDDQSLLRVALVAAVRRALGDCRVTEFEDADAFLASVEAGARFDLVTLDLNMPGLSGMAAVSRIRQRLPGARLVVISSLAEWNAADEALAAGADLYVAKSGTGVQDLADAIAGRGWFRH